MTQSDHAPVPETPSAPPKRRFPRLATILLSALGVGVVAAGIAYFCQPTQFEVTGIIQIRPVVTPLPFNSPGILPFFDQFVQTQTVVLKNERCVELAMNSPRCLKKENARSNSEVAKQHFMESLRVARDQEIIRVSFRDPDPNTASDAVVAMIEAYQGITNDIAIDADQPLRRQQQLEQLKADYEKKLEDGRRMAAEAANPYTPEILESRSAYKATELNQAETEMKQSDAAVENWKTLHSGQASPSPADASLELLEAKAALDKQRYDEHLQEVAALGRATTQIREITAEQQQTMGWLSETKQKLEEIRVQRMDGGRIFIVSTGEQPVAVDGAKRPLTAGVGGAAFLVTLVGAGLMGRRRR